MSGRFAIILVVLVAIFGGIFVFSKNKAGAPSAGSSGNAAQSTSHIEGSSKTGVVLTEYGDFQCPACSAEYPLVKQVVEAYKDRIQFQFVNFPLYQIHQNAMAAHRAAEAASNQGKFWEMYDLLYQNHDSWANGSTPTSQFEGYAQQLGLDIGKFKTDAASSTTNDTIWADINKGKALDISGTPTFYIDGKKIDANPTSVDEFNKLIDAAIAQKAGTTAQ